MAIPIGGRDRVNRKPRQDQDAFHRDKGTPAGGESHERDPGGNAIQTLTGYADEFFPGDAPTFQGGGLTEPSDIDHATTGTTERHEDGYDWKTERAHADVLHDEEYGYAGLGHLDPPKMPATVDDVIKALKEFARSSYKDVVLTRDVATNVHYNTYNITVGSDPLPVAGENWERKRLLIWAPSTNTAAVLIGLQNNLSNAGQASGAGQVVMEAGKWPPLELEHNASVVAQLPAGAAANQVLCVIDETYERPS